jgi:hypothetical protein
VNDNGPNLDAGGFIYGNVTSNLGDCSDSGANIAADDVLNRAVSGGYYGHPNRNRSPTPECNFRSGGTYTLPAFDYGLHTSSDGIAEYTSSALPGLTSQIVTANWGSQEIVSVFLASISSGVAGQVIRSGLNRPVDLTVRTSDGAIFVAEYGLPPQTPFISVLRVKSAPLLNYDGDERSDLVTFTSASGTWSVRPTATGVTSTTGPFGGGGDVPFAMDYLGTGQAQLAVWRPSTGQWFINGIAIVASGQIGDLAVRTSF